MNTWSFILSEKYKITEIGHLWFSLDSDQITRIKALFYVMELVLGKKQFTQQGLPLICLDQLSKPKYIQFSITENKEKQQIVVAKECFLFLLHYLFKR